MSIIGDIIKRSKKTTDVVRKEDEHLYKEMKEAFEYYSKKNLPYFEIYYIHDTGLLHGGLELLSMSSYNAEKSKLKEDIKTIAYSKDFVTFGIK